MEPDGDFKESPRVASPGLSKIVAIKASINQGLTEKLKIAFPRPNGHIFIYYIKINITTVHRPQTESMLIRDPQ